MSARGRAAKPAHIRFWNYVNKQDDECWVWTASVRADGYGEFRVNGRLVRAHRFAYELLVSPIPDGLVIDHLCRNRACVNPAHLEAVTTQVNIQRGASAHILHTGRCIHGHVMSASNVYVRPDTGQRMCRRCRANDYMRGRSSLPTERKSA